MYLRSSYNQDVNCTSTIPPSPILPTFKLPEEFSSIEELEEYLMSYNDIELTTAYCIEYARLLFETQKSHE